MHSLHSPGDIPWIIYFILVSVLVAYWAAALRLRLHGKRWSTRRGVCFTLGVGMLAVAFSPLLLSSAGGEFTGHMAQHLLIGMIASIPLALSAPVTLLLATLPARPRSWVLRVLHVPPLRVVAHPVTAGVLDIGSMFILYLTPLYAAMLDSGPLHSLIMVHFLLAGYLFSWSIIGIDPSPGRPSWIVRLIVLIFAAASHAILSKLMYAHGFPRGTDHPLADIQAGAQLMYYGGDLAEVLLALVLCSRWYLAKGRRYARELSAREQATGTA